MRISPRYALRGYRTLTLVNASLTDKALIYLLSNGIALCYFTAAQLLYLLNLHLLFVKKKKSSQILCNLDEVLFEKATLLIKAEVKIWHSESVTLCRPLKSVSPFTFSNPARGTQVSLGESDEGWVHSFYSRMWLTRLGLWAVYTIEPKISHYLFFLYELHTMSGAQITVLKYSLTCSFFRANLQNNDPV